MQRYKFKYKETSTTILAEDKQEYLRVISRILEARFQVEFAISAYPYFYVSLEPIEVNVIDEICKKSGLKLTVPKRMCQASKLAEVGPMAAVAGGIAHYSVESSDFAFAVVDNGGDIVIKSKKPRKMNIGIFPSSLAIKLEVEGLLSICTSSGRYGHSISFGDADAATVIANDGFIADAFATALCNKIKPEYEKKEIEAVMNKFWRKAKEHLIGIVVIKDNFIGIAGEVELVKANVKEELITRG